MTARDGVGRENGRTAILMTKAEIIDYLYDIHTHADYSIEDIAEDLVVPVRHGHWIGGEIGKCSVCGHKGCSSDIWNDGNVMFCPHCGARMDGDHETD